MNREAVKEIEDLQVAAFNDAAIKTDKVFDSSTVEPAIRGAVAGTIHTLAQFSDADILKIIRS